jgi:hypothetical protein
VRAREILAKLPHEPLETLWDAAPVSMATQHDSDVPSNVLTASQRALLKGKSMELAKPLQKLTNAELDDWIGACAALERMSENAPRPAAKARRKYRAFRLEAEAERDRRREKGQRD